MAARKRLLLIDSHALIHRAFHAFPPDLTNSSGEVVNAVYGFSRLLLEVLQKFSPDYVIAAMDAPGPTVRHQQFGDYKANRSSPDDLLIQQIPLVEDLLAKFDIPTLKVQGFEADDIIGTLDDQFGKEGHGHETIIVTGDRDLFQLVDKDTKVYLAGTSFSKSKLYDSEGVEEKMGVGPDYIIDIKALEGDSSDNIPGVAGIGKKGAAMLVSDFGHLDEIYKKLEAVPKRYQNKLTESYEIAHLSKQLATIIKDVPLNCEFEDGRFGTFSSRELREFFQTMEFNSLLRSLDKLIEAHEIYEEEETSSIDALGAAGQLSLLASNAAVQKADLQKWDKEVLGERIVCWLETNQEGDPLNWSLKELLVWDNKEEKVLKVNIDLISNFFELQSSRTKQVQIVCTDAKALFHVAMNLEVELDSFENIHIYDLSLATYVVSMGRTKQDLDSILSFYKLGYADAELAKLAKLVLAADKHFEDTDTLAGFAEILELENKLIPVIVRMERNGVVLDKQLIQKYAEILDKKIDETKDSIYKDVGHEFNIGSPKQVGQVLFEEKGLPVVKKTKSGSYSTDERSLKTILDADPVVQKILDYREYTKLLSTYVKPLPALVNNKTGRIHAVFNQMGAITGRFSSQNPNMQNIPVGKTAGIVMRDVFKAGEGAYLVALDYSQQELRLLAELSGEENMLAAFKNGKDIHAVAASEIFGIPLGEVTKDKRRIGKTINFGIVYGISPFGLADRLKISQKEAKDYIEKYFDRYPKVREYYDALIKQAKEEGFVSTIYGRKRHTAELNSRNYALRQATERESMNYPLQGSAADLTKLAMLKVSGITSKYEAKMLLQVHDELIFEYKYDGSVESMQNDGDFKSFIKEVKLAMLTNDKLKVPLAIGVDVGKRWGQMQEIAL